MSDPVAVESGIEPTTGVPYDAYDLPEGCTGYYREDLDWGDVLTHRPDRPCLVHDPNNCPLCGNRGAWCPPGDPDCTARMDRQRVDVQP